MDSKMEAVILWLSGVDKKPEATQCAILLHMIGQDASTVVTHMKSIFARHGIPEELISDNMPYSSLEFRKFAKEWDFNLTTSSPTYPQSNGLSERAVQTMKGILKKSTDPYLGLLEYRNTPLTRMDYTPTQLLMSRVARTNIPTSTELLKPKIVTNAHEQLKKCQDKQKYFYDKHTKPLPPLNQHDTVRIEKGKQWVPAIVTAKASTPRSYINKSWHKMDKSTEEIDVTT
ncbi:hypothetical protein QZH41_006012 [Actinostola sp. cb2023]|nr:hypothetical protein QZH41_006012 [Actinostola sp. cb2023]